MQLAFCCTPVRYGALQRLPPSLMLQQPWVCLVEHAAGICIETPPPELE